MKILATGDVHIFNYASYNMSWDGDIPSRLELFSKLAEVLHGVAVDKGCEEIWIAGDLVHSPMLRPMVHNRTLRFLEVLTGQFGDWKNRLPVRIIHGQHDLDDKATKLSLENSVVRIAGQVDGVEYVDDDVWCLGDDKNVDVHFLGWRPVPPIIENIGKNDVFVGHGMVAASRNKFGHTFASGFNLEALCSQFRLSIIGDIHQQQIMTGENGNRILIPGPPIQHSFSDPEECGVWIVDLEDLEGELEFVRIEDPVFPIFRIVDTPAQVVPQDNVFHKMAPTVATGTQGDKTVATVSDLESLVKSTVEGQKIPQEHVEAVMDLSLSLLAQVDQTKRAVNLPEVLVSKLSLRNFGSCGWLELDFKEIGHSMILGPVGSGKSTILKGLGWALYGIVVGSKGGDDLVPVGYDGSEGVVAQSEFDTGGGTFSVMRTYSHSKLGNSLRVFQHGPEGKTEIKRGGIRETQGYINSLLGMDWEDFETLCYYSQTRGSFFGTMSGPYQSKLLMRLLGDLEEQLEQLTALSKAQVKKAESALSENEGSWKTLCGHKHRDSERLKVLTFGQKAEEATMAAQFFAEGLLGIPDRVVSAAMEPRLSFDDKVRVFLMSLNWSAVGLDPIEDSDALQKMTTSLATALATVNEGIASRNHSINARMIDVEVTTASVKAMGTQCATLRDNKCQSCNRTFDRSPNEASVAGAEVERLEAAMTKDRADMKKLAEEVQELEGDIGKLKERKTVLESQAHFCTETVARMFKFKKAIAVVVVDVSAEITSLENSIEVIDKDIGSQESAVQVATTLVERVKLVQSKVFSNRGVFAKALESIGGLLSDYMNQILSNAGSDLRVTINTVSFTKAGLPSTKLDVKLDFGDGKNLSYSQLSGGQSMLVNALALVGFYNVLSDRHGLDKGLLGFLALDEVIQYVDDRYVDIVRSILEEVTARCCLVISHNPGLASVYDRVISVRLVGHISEYTVR